MVKNRREDNRSARTTRPKGKKGAPPKKITLEQWYALANDASLNSAGIEIGARAQILPKGPPKLRIVFRVGKLEATVDCVHVAVYAGSMELMPPVTQLARSSENYPVKLAPEEHFFALNSYVAGIAEVGIGAMFAIAREMGRFSVGFNTLMQQQVLRALFEVAPVAAWEFCLWVKDDAGKNAMLTNIDEVLVEIIDQKHDLPQEFLVHLSEDSNKDVRVAVAARMDTPPDVLARLAGDSHYLVKVKVARNRFAPVDAVKRLSRDSDWVIRAALALNRGIPPEIRARLADDPVLQVRRKAVNEDGSKIISEDDRIRWYRDRDGYEWSEETEDHMYENPDSLFDQYKLTEEDLADAPTMPAGSPPLEDEDAGEKEKERAKNAGDRKRKPKHSKRGG